MFAIGVSSPASVCSSPGTAPHLQRGPCPSCCCLGQAYTFRQMAKRPRDMPPAVRCHKRRPPFARGDQGSVVPAIQAHAMLYGLRGASPRGRILPIADSEWSYATWSTGVNFPDASPRRSAAGHQGPGRMHYVGRRPRGSRSRPRPRERGVAHTASLMHGASERRGPPRRSWCL